MSASKGRAAPRVPMPRPGTVGPMLAKTGSLPEDDDGWAYEIKWDGVRALVFADDGRVAIATRRGNDVTARYPELAGLGRAIGRRAVVDGEIVAMDEDGRPSFQRLQRRMGVTTDAEVQKRLREALVTFVAFDLLFLDDRWTTDLPYHERRRLLAGLGLHGDHWQTPSFHMGDGREFLAIARHLGLEGIVAKRADSPYRVDARSSEWLKVKDQARQELVVGGWTEGEGRREGTIGALLVGYYADDPDDGSPRLRYAGKVGTGFDATNTAELERRLRPLARPTSPFVGDAPRGARWVEPELVAEIEFTEWTRAGTLRHPSFKGLRDDKDPGDVVRERTGRSASRSGSRRT